VLTIINIKPMGNPQCQIKIKWKKMPHLQLYNLLTYVKNKSSSAIQMLHNVSYCIGILKREDTIFATEEIRYYKMH